MSVIGDFDGGQAGTERPSPTPQPIASHQFRGSIAELDGLRGIAIFLVVIHHFWPKVQGPHSPWNEYAHLGWIGVDLFFVISGFLICGILLDTVGEPGYYLNFYARRSLRIFPLYYLFLLVVFTGVPAVQGGPYFETEFLQESGSPIWYILYAGNLREAIFGREPAYFLAPLWSLSIEEQFYISFPFVVTVLGIRHLGSLLISLIFLAPFFRTVMFFLVPDNERIQYLATFSRMDVISLGCLLAWALRRGKLQWKPSSTSLILIGLALGSAVAFHFNGLDRTLPFCRTLGYSLIGFTFASLLLWAIQHRGASVTALLRFSPLTYLGKICYGVYLLQRPAEVVLLRILGRAGLDLPPESIALMLLKIAFAILVASASWYVFEKPVLRLKNRFVSRNHPSSASISEAAVEPAA